MLFIGDGQRRHTDQLDEAKRQIGLFDIQHLGHGRSCQDGRGGKKLGKTGHIGP